MFIFAGLGNPGSRYVNTRHNFGFMVADHFQAKLLKMPENIGRSSEWKLQLACLYWQARLGSFDLVLMKPQSFMNRSGAAVKELLDYYKWECDGFLVAHDELDIPFGAIRFKIGGGDGGHNGIKSVTQALNSYQHPKLRDFARLRLGIGRPTVDAAVDTGVSQVANSSVSDWVLGHFSLEQGSKLSEILDRAVEAILVYYLDGLKKAQNLFNR